MSSNLRSPGVQVTVTGEGLPPITEAAPAQMFLVGEFQWGRPDRPILIGSLSEFRREFGSKVPYSKATVAYEQAENIASGSLRAWVSRVFHKLDGFEGQLRADALSGATSVILGSLGDLTVGQPIRINGQELVVTALNPGLNLVTFTPALSAAAETGDSLIREGETYDDYSSKCMLESDDADELEQVAACPGSIGNTFQTEVVPGGPNPALDRLVRTTCRDKSFTYEWRALPALPTPVELGQPGYTDYVVAKQAYDLLKQAVTAANAETVRNINVQAEQLGIDFSLRVPTGAAGSPLKTTGDQLGYRIHVTAFPWGGGGNGSALDAASAFATERELMALTPNSVLIGTEHADGRRTGIQAFNDTLYGTGAIMMPGRSDLVVWHALDEHAYQFDRLALLAFSEDVLDRNVAYGIKSKASLSKASTVHFPWVLKDSEWCSPEGVIMGLGSRETASQSDDGGIKASWTGYVAIEGISQRFGNDAVGTTDAEFFYRDDVRINWIRQTKLGYRVEAQKLAVPEGATSRISHAVCNNVFIHSIEPILEYTRDKPIDAEGKLVGTIIETVMNWLDDYGPGKSGARGNTFYEPAFLADATTLNDLNTFTIRAEGDYSLTPHAERVFINFKQRNIAIK